MWLPNFERFCDFNFCEWPKMKFLKFLFQHLSSNIHVITPSLFSSLEILNTSLFRSLLQIQYSAQNLWHCCSRLLHSHQRSTRGNLALWVNIAGDHQSWHTTPLDWFRETDLRVVSYSDPCCAIFIFSDLLFSFTNSKYDK